MPRPTAKATSPARSTDPDEVLSAEDYKKLSNIKTQPSKFRAKPTTIDGIRFDSKLEASYYRILKIRESQGEIEGLVLQPVFELHGITGHKICDYVADFLYWDNMTNRREIVDCKGVLTPLYRMKRRMMKDEHGIEIKEIYRDDIPRSFQ